LSTTAQERVALSSPIAVVEEVDTVPAATVILKKNVDTTNNRQAKTSQIKGAIVTSDEKVRRNDAEPNGTEPIIQPAKKKPTRKPEKPVESAEAALSTIEAVEPARISEEDVTTAVSLSEEAPVNMEETPGQARTTERRHLVKSAGLVSLGNFGSSVLGMLRQVALSRLGSLYAGPFIAALTPANNFYQLLVNGAVSGALIPAFNDYSASEKRNELRRIVFTLVNLVLLITVIAAIGYTLISPWFINVLLSQLPSEQRGLALQYSQIIFFSLLALGPFSILLAALYSLKEFGWPAFATAAYHIGIILGAIGVALFGAHYIGQLALPLGVLVGSAGEIVLLMPGIRKQQLQYMFVLDLKHPALRHIYKLYLPVFLGFLFTTGAVLLDLSLQSQTREHATTIAAMGFATTLIQFPVGLVAAALSFAVLPTLSEHVREGNNERFKQTLLLGFRLGLLLMIPAMVGLITLRTPITYLLFAHGKFGTSGADFTALALQNYAYQLPFIALDQLLIAAFYARKNTKTPVIIGVVAIVFYLLVALPFYRNIGMPALAFANTVQNSMHAIILLILLRRVMGVLHIRASLPTILKICVAATAMGLVTWGALMLLDHVSLFSLQHIRCHLLTVIVAGVLAIAVYIGAVLLLKVEEIHMLKGAIMAKLGKK
ncbi:MAG: murein biosynthesis integral membrane protein MurJ, partial [Ktedonobacteraceae bacterium]